ncbi:ATP-binding protein [Aurantimonas sp. MSK8Z-1]|uniref:ATP-binding protein n=1 Tax=Mangrovibrevibacter kandeliae TaxID=2968473 RepID=UPI002118FC5A|nr:ATP-binding protein [Aurantimonas sp. MSK8Z-1]MCW4114894.1 ATP-binding protein [Aurantimonas sp. MSK8Z-1]
MIWQPLLANLALVAIMVNLFDMAAARTAGFGEPWPGVTTGALLGIGAVIAMGMLPPPMPGVFIDLRVPFVGAAGLFGGVPGALVAGAMSGAYRFHLGGQGAPAGLLSLVLATGAGLMVYRLRRLRGRSVLDVMALAALLAAANLVSIFALPDQVFSAVLASAVLPLVVLTFGGTAIIGLSLDGVERRRTLEKTNLIYRAMVEQLPDNLNFKDVDGRFVIVNPATATSLGQQCVEDVVGHTDDDFHPKDLAQAYRQHEEAVLQSRNPSRIEEPFKRPDGSSGWLSTLKVPLTDGSGRLLGIITHNRDITDERQSAEAKKDFIALISHELRTPLTSIRGSLGLISSGVAGQLPPRAASLMSIAHSNCERLILLVNDILDIEKIASGKMAIEMRPVQLRPLLQHALAAHADYLPEKQIKLVLLDDAPGAAVSVDPDRLHQALSNLLSNALKFSPDGSTVTVGSVAIAGAIRIFVRDEGPGIPVEFQSRIFGRFEQAEAASTRRSGGTGLGLNITRAIVERMDGRIDFTSAIGTGTTFTIDLPAVVAAPGPAPHNSAAAGPLENHRILICGSDRTLNGQVGEALASTVFSSDLAPDLDACLRLVGERPYAALVLDGALLEEGAAHFFTALRGGEVGRTLPVIMLCSDGAATAEHRGLASEVLDWLTAPLDQHRLRAALSAIVKRNAGGRVSILHVEDDMSVLEVFAQAVGDKGAVVAARSVEEARRRLRSQDFDAVVLDQKLPDGSGFDLLSDVPAGTPVIVFSAYDVAPDLAGRVTFVITKSKTRELDVAAAVLQAVGPTNAPAVRASGAARPAHFTT